MVAGLMRDPREPKPLKARTLSVLVVDANNFSRGLVAEILRGLDITNISAARNEEDACACLAEQPIDLILMSWEPGDQFDALGFCRALRRTENDRLRRLPVILVTASLTRQMTIDGRDAGVDEFLARPISPGALKQRLEMVIETPRPFVDCAVFIGPCRRRKNPADYHGAKRRDSDRANEPSAPMVDQEEEAAKTPIRVALAGLRSACEALDGRRRDTLDAAKERFWECQKLAVETNDHALHAALASFDAYVSVTVPQGHQDALVIGTALGALEQLASLPLGYTDARDSVAMALSKAIQKKLAA
ncbi:MAG: response regulator [Alphaproteobacteria bacterium]|nr:response regulator [Alphaproteobacteria bacterium]